MEAEKNLQRRKLKGCACCAGFCALPVLDFVFMFSCWLWHVMYYHSFGENEPSAPMFYTEKGTNYSYDVTYSWSLIEFTISEVDFLDWCKKLGWKPVEIKDVPSLPQVEYDRDNDAAWPRINQQQGHEIPLKIARYNYKKPEHAQCKSSYYYECQIDPPGKTDDACFRSVDDGYYYESRRRSAGGVHVLYDRENNRCYVQKNPR